VIQPTVSGPDGRISLATLIAEDPKGQLGSEVAGEFGSRLAVPHEGPGRRRAASLQAHPDAEYARRAFAAQEADPAAPRNLHRPVPQARDAGGAHAVRALCGFRAPDVSAAVLEELGVPRLAPVVAALRAGGAGLREAVRTLLSWPADDRRPLVDAVLAAAGDTSHALVAELAEHYPGDPGVLVALLLNHVRLEPGEAIWLPAGNLHAYLSGAAVEIMAASDNVLRGGLTSKRVDVDELMRVLRFEVLDEPVLRPVEVAPGVVTWPVPAREFALYRIRLDGGGRRSPVPAAAADRALHRRGRRGARTVATSASGPVAGATDRAAAYAPADAAMTVAGGRVFVRHGPE
jgi:mannose-6-phosphate isomerase